MDVIPDKPSGGWLKFAIQVFFAFFALNLVFDALSIWGPTTINFRKYWTQPLRSFGLGGTTTAAPTPTNG